MPLLSAPVEEAAVADAIASMNSELVYLLESSQVPPEIIAKFGVIGYSDVETFAHMEVNATAVREMIKSDITLDPAGGPQHRAMMARLLAVWEAAGKRASKLKEEEAAQRAGDLPRHIPKGKHLEIVKAYAKAHKTLKDKECPAPCYLEWRFEQIEDGELKAESLADVVNKEEASDEDWGGARVTPDGSIKLVKGRSSGKAPENPEALRAKIRMMGVAWEFMRLKFPGRPYLKDLTAETWSDHVEWLLGEDVYGNIVKDSSGAIAYRPSWATVLELDFRVRKQAYQLVNENGSTLKEAMVAAREDTALFQKYFITPVSLAAGAEAARSTSSKRQAPQEWALPPPTRQADGSSAMPVSFGAAQAGPNGKGKGRAKGRGKQQQGRQQQFQQRQQPQQQPQQQPRQNDRSQGSRWSDGERNVTPDGRMKCFRYQRNKCTDPNCPRVHVCLVCNGKHPKIECPKRPRGGDAAGRPANFQ